jgi:hypothetical protein
MTGWWSGNIQTGDWIKATETIPITLSDHLSGDGIRPGTRGAATGVSGSRVTVEFESGWGTYTATVDQRKVTKIRSGGGVDRFRGRARTTALVRLGLAIALLFPTLYFVGAYLWTFGTFDGIIPAFLEASIASLGDWISAALAHPFQTLIFSVVVGLISRWVFRSR